MTKFAQSLPLAWLAPMVAVAAATARADTLHQMTVKHVDLACQIGADALAAHLTVAHNVVDGHSAVTSRTASLGGQPLQLTGTCDDASGALLVDSLYDDGAIKSLSIDPAHPDAATMIWHGAKTTLTGCRMTPSSLVIDMDQLHETELLAATDGAAETRIVQRQYQGQTDSLCYQRSPAFGLVFLAPEAGALPNLLAAVRLDLAQGNDSPLRRALADSGLVQLLDTVDDVTFRTDVTQSAFPVVSFLVSGDAKKGSLMTAASLHSCDEW